MNSVVEAATEMVGQVVAVGVGVGVLVAVGVVVLGTVDESSTVVPAPVQAWGTVLLFKTMASDGSNRIGAAAFATTRNCNVWIVLAFKIGSSHLMVLPTCTQAPEAETTVTFAGSVTDKTTLGRFSAAWRLATVVVMVMGSPT